MKVVVAPRQTIPPADVFPATILVEAATPTTVQEAIVFYLSSFLYSRFILRHVVRFGRKMTRAKKTKNKTCFRFFLRRSCFAFCVVCFSTDALL